MTFGLEHPSRGQAGKLIFIAPWKGKRRKVDGGGMEDCNNDASTEDKTCKLKAYSQEQLFHKKIVILYTSAW